MNILTRKTGEISILNRDWLNRLLKENRHYSNIRRSLVISLILLVFGNALAGTTGRIAGTVTSAEGNPLVGASVIVDGTPYGAITDPNGEYFINILTPAEYSLSARMVGMAEVTKEGIIVVADQSTTVDFSLQEQAAGRTVIRVTDQRSLILQDVPSTIYVIDRDEIRLMPVIGLLDVVSRQPGIVSRGGAIHVRGGRAGEVSFLLDGISTQSPLSNAFISTVPLMALSRTSIITGGFPAEYGNAMSGIVNMITRDGGDDFEANLQVRTGEMTEFGYENISRNYSEPSENNNFRSDMINLECSIGGPEPVTTHILPSIGIEIPGEMRFFAAASYIRSGRDLQDSRGYWENNWQNGITASGKLTYRPTGRTRISLLSYYTWRNMGWDEWLWSRYDQAVYINDEIHLGGDPDYALPIKFQENAGATISLTHSFSDIIFMNLSLNQNRTCNWRRVEDRNGGYIGEGYEPNDWYVFFLPQPRIADEFGFYHSGIHPDVWLDSRSTVTNLKFNLTSFLNSNIELKTGLEARYYDIYDYSVYVEDQGDIYTSLWRAYPFSGALYAMAKVESSGGLVVTPGIRLDMFDANTAMYELEEGGSIDVSRKYQLSPRLGISHPVTDRDVFFSTYGHYFQMANFNQLFYGTDYNLSGSYNIIGNPDLDAQRTIAYEAGLRHRFNDLSSISVSVFNKDVTGLVRTANNSSVTPGEYYIYENDDSHGTLRGLELKFLRLPGSILSGSMSYTYSISKGRYSSSVEQRGYSSSGFTFPPPEDSYLDWDQRHTADAQVNLVVPREEGPELGGLRPFEGTSLTISWTWGSGFPYSPPSGGSEQPQVNTERYPFTMETNIGLTRQFWPGFCEIELGLTIYNLFNRQNLIRIFDTGYYMETSEPGGVSGNPGTWSPARHIMLRLGVSF
ncbi:MAG: TonB-dependent receptor [Candidatus Aegiribacteria sp.]|nr:TonB-dependent receptor [Candidatus Aegiribacteria sp.]